MNKKKLAVLSLAALTALSLAGCSGTGAEVPASAGETTAAAQTTGAPKTKATSFRFKKYPANVDFEFFDEDSNTCYVNFSIDNNGNDEIVVSDEYTAVNGYCGYASIYKTIPAGGHVKCIVPVEKASITDIGGDIATFFARLRLFKSNDYYNSIEEPLDVLDVEVESEKVVDIPDFTGDTPIFEEKNVRIYDAGTAYNIYGEGVERAICVVNLSDEFVNVIIDEPKMQDNKQTYMFAAYLPPMTKKIERLAAEDNFSHNRVDITEDMNIAKAPFLVLNDDELYEYYAELYPDGQEEEEASLYEISEDGTAVKFSLQNNPEDETYWTAVIGGESVSKTENDSMDLYTIIFTGIAPGDSTILLKRTDGEDIYDEMTINLGVDENNKIKIYDVFQPAG